MLSTFTKEKKCQPMKRAREREKEREREKGEREGRLTVFYCRWLASFGLVGKGIEKISHERRMGMVVMVVVVAARERRGDGGNGGDGGRGRRVGKVLVLFAVGAAEVEDHIFTFSTALDGDDAEALVHRDLPDGREAAEEIAHQHPVFPVPQLQRPIGTGHHAELVMCETRNRP
jgi:hypothetical protein